MKYEQLFSPYCIGKLELKNRIIMTAAGVEMNGNDGESTPQIMGFYEERAKGGVAAIVSGVCRVTKDDTGASAGTRQTRMDDDRHIEEQRKLVERLHRYNCKYIVQLQHPGNATLPRFTNGKTPVSASDVPSLIYTQPIRPLTIEEIKTITQEFGDAALRCQKAGVDGVELHAAHYYLFHQFLSPTFNKRTDEYGGNTENRFRFLKEVIEDIRAKCGPDYPIIVRVSIEEYLGMKGLHLVEGLKICQLLDATPIDAISVSVSGSSSPLSHSIEPISYPQGWRDYAFSAVKKLVSKPIIATGVIRDPSYAEKLLQENRLDFIGSFRNLLADPNWANKTLQNQENEINRCISCVRCIEDLRQGLYVSCSINAEAGHETKKFPTSGGAGRKVVVIGGGVAGMEAARVLALRGFKPVLFEQTANLGGQVHLSTAIPHKDKMNWYLQYQRLQLQKLKVDVRLQTSATLENIKKEEPYAVIDATGATPLVPARFKKEGFVFDPQQILSGAISLENKHIAIIGSGLTGLETALYLVHKGNYITVIEMEDKIAKTAYWVTVKDVTKYLDTYDVSYLTNMQLDSVQDGYLVLKDVLKQELVKFPVDAAVLSLGFRAQSPLKIELEKIYERYYPIGDRYKEGRIKEAVHAGYQVASQLK